MVGTALTIERRDLLHPDAVRLVAEVQAEYVERYGGPDEAPMDPTEFAPGAGAFFVGYETLSGEPVATGAWRWVPAPSDMPAGRCVEVKRMYVAAGHRKLGHARTLLVHLERTAREAGAVSVVLETGIRQPEAIGLYESTGYEAIAGYGYYADSPLSRCYGKVLMSASEAAGNYADGIRPNS